MNVTCSQALHVRTMSDRHSIRLLHVQGSELCVHYDSKVWERLFYEKKLEFLLWKMYSMHLCVNLLYLFYRNHRFYLYAMNNRTAYRYKYNKLALKIFYYRTFYINNCK